MEPIDEEQTSMSLKEAGPDAAHTREVRVDVSSRDGGPGSAKSTKQAVDAAENEAEPETDKDGYPYSKDYQNWKIKTGK